MRKLEGDLRVKLLVRAGREVTLTREGIDLLPKARRSLEDIEATLDALRVRTRERETVLAVGCLPAVAATHLPNILRDFDARRRGCFLCIHDNSAKEIAHLLQSGMIELAITTFAAGGSDLEIETLTRESFVLI